MGKQRDSAQPRSAGDQPAEEPRTADGRGRFSGPWILWLLLALAGAGLLAAAIAVLSANMRVVQVLPQEDEAHVAITAPLRVVFSREPDAASLESHFHIEPEVAGSWVVEGEDAFFLANPALDPGVTYTATLETGLRGQGDRQLATDLSWQFRTRDPQLLYLGRTQPGEDVRQLFVASLDLASRQLTEEAKGVWDYAVHPQGEGIVYSVLRDDGGADLWRMDRDGNDQQVLLACPEAACLGPAWAPDGVTLAYERRDIWADAPNLDPKAGRIWILDLEDGEDRPLFDYDVALHSPLWAPVGRRLATMSPALPGVEAYDLDTGELQQFANEWGASPAWSPDGDSLVLPELMLAGEDLVVRLVRIDLDDEHLLDISGDDDFVKDMAPAWSPGGGWIALGRQFLDDERWTPGRQIWLTRPDASEAYGLPAEAMADHFAFAWRPDGGALAYARTDLSQGPQVVPDVSVWIFDFGRGEPRSAGDDAVLPKWLP